MNPTKRAVERPTPALNNSNIKATQCSKIRELRQALVKAGHLTLDQQTESLGLGRSTAWAILQGNHKPLGYRRRPSNECSPRSNFPRPPERYFWSTSRRNWRALMGTTKRSFAGFVSGSARTVSGPKAFFTRTAHVRDGCVQGGRTVASASMVVIHDMVAESAGTAQKSAAQSETIRK